MQADSYRVGKFDKGLKYLVTKESVDDGALCTLYRLTYENEHLGWFADFDAAKAKAEAHHSSKSDVLGADGTARKGMDR